MRETRVAKDSSGRGNHITLVNLPGASKQRISKGDNGLETGVLTMRNNYAMNSSFTGMPARWVQHRMLSQDPAPCLLARWDWVGSHQRLS